MSKPVRGEIWQTRFSPTTGAEIGKDRPAVVMNAPEIGRLPLSIVVPITEWKAVFEDYSWFVCLEASPDNGLAKTSGADAFQVKSLSDVRLLNRLGFLTAQEVDQIAESVAICVGI